MSRGPRNWSVSAARLYLSCPQAFKFRYVDWVKVERTEVPIHWRRGTVVHAGLEAAWKHRRATRGHGPMLADDVWEVARKALVAAWEEEAMPAPVASNGMWDDVLLMVEATLRDQTESWEDIVDVEHKLFVRPGVNIIGYVDLLLNREAGVYRARDWKTRKSKSTPDQLRNDFQGRLYAGMIYRKFPDVELVEFSHYYPPIAEEVVVEIDRDAGEEAISKIRSVRDMVTHESEWKPNKGSACETCAFKSMCPAWSTENADDELMAQIDLF